VWTITISLRALHIFNHVDTTGEPKKEKKVQLGFSIFFFKISAVKIFSRNVHLAIERWFDIFQEAIIILAWSMFQERHKKDSLSFLLEAEIPSI
jgi:hypothetical protein